MGRFWEDLLSTLLEIFEQGLVGLFAAKGSSYYEEHFSKEQSANNNNQTETPMQKLDEAFRLFGISRPKEAVTEEVKSQIKKEYRRLCRLHHPDKNNNSEESKQMTQTLNASYEMVCQELDRLETNDVHNDSTQEVHPDVDDGSYFDEEEYADWEDEIRRQEKELEARIRQQRQEFHRQMQQIQKEKQRIRQRPPKNMSKRQRRKQKRHTQTSRPPKKEDATDAYNFFEIPVPTREEVCKFPEARLAAHHAWKTVVKRYDDFQSIHSPPEPESKDATLRPTKPRNLVMESCTEDIVLALRLGNMEAFVSLLDGEALFHCRELEDEIEAYNLVARRPRDSDANTLTHYIAYYGSIMAWNLIMARLGECYVSAVLETNYWDQRPVDYCIEKDDFYEQVQLATDTATQELHDRKIGPQLRRSSARLLAMLRYSNAITILHTLVGVLFGKCVFHCSIPTAILFCIVGSYLEPMDEASFLVSMHLVWACCRWMYSSYKMLDISMFVGVPALLLLLVFLGRRLLVVVLEVFAIFLKFFTACDGELSRLCRLTEANEQLVDCFHLVAYGSVIWAVSMALT